MLSDTKTDSNRPKYSGAAPGVGIVDFASIPAHIKPEVIPLVAPDGVPSRGVLYSTGEERTVVVISHPRADVSRHFIISTVLEAGFAAYAHQCRGLNNDVAAIHEKLVLDIATGLKYLREVRGFEKIVFFGMSGGGALFCFYQEQSSIAPPGRLRDTAAGDPNDLNLVDLPKADGMALLAFHPGEGLFMMQAIDPSVVDESDPLSIDPSLDMYNPDNGFREPPQVSSYREEFIARYRAAQVARVAGLDAIARGYIAEQNRFKALQMEPKFKELPLHERIYIERRAVVGRYMIIYRTEADPACCDTSLFAAESTRTVGSMLGPRPDIVNYAEGGLARYLTPRAWLSSWSGLSSRAAMPKNIRSIAEPTLMLCFTRDNGCFPSQARQMFADSPAKDKEFGLIDADHYGYPLVQRTAAGKRLTEWMAKRFQ